ncbi:YggS family pyridoxal phosphate-dependent enzyme [Streptococcus sp. sy010]|uniref:YggS family pyridoxal phosphate-dependent enzyme n=1 Tax=Streptococcus sp. sy010 TaxID=2600148 RepID=UPI0011B4BBD8|nr:YggS family pyridoxal phosphate-dependent enzyme [Streptococcus sp. sy010]TWT16559.1 YggS family pyridoxal phosphate-dependent enzyme [Streptococcus sp. sy010]
MNLAKNKQEIMKQVAVLVSDEQKAQPVEVIAVTKYVDVATTQALVDLGHHHLGENRVDKFLEKYHQVKGDVLTWHFIGSLQRRKVKEVIDYIDYFHALDSLNLALEIQKRASKPVKCFLQINISKETSKHGVYIEELDDLLEELAKLDKIILVGLMTMTPFEASDDEKQAIFRQARLLRERLAEKKIAHMPFKELSMGMSGDFALAIKEGATFVRIGQSFFKE